MSDIFEQAFKDVVEETQCLLELSETDAKLIFNAGRNAAVEHCKQGEPVGEIFNGNIIAGDGKYYLANLDNLPNGTKLFTQAMPKSDGQAVYQIMFDGVFQDVDSSEYQREDMLEKRILFTTTQPSTDISELQPRLTVRLTSFPESNGKRNWTALLMRTESFDGLIGSAGGISLAHSELWNRVAYEAERAKYLIGERDNEPDILDYGDDIHTPEEWQGGVRNRFAKHTVK